MPAEYFKVRIQIPNFPNATRCATCLRLPVLLQELYSPGSTLTVKLTWGIGRKMNDHRSRPKRWDKTSTESVRQLGLTSGSLILPAINAGAIYRCPLTPPQQAPFLCTIQQPFILVTMHEHAASARCSKTHVVVILRQFLVPHFDPMLTRLRSGRDVVRQGARCVTTLMVIAMGKCLGSSISNKGLSLILFLSYSLSSQLRTLVILYQKTLLFMQVLNIWTFQQYECGATIAIVPSDLLIPPFAAELIRTCEGRILIIWVTPETIPHVGRSSYDPAALSLSRSFLVGQALSSWRRHSWKKKGLQTNGEALVGSNERKRTRKDVGRIDSLLPQKTFTCTVPLPYPKANPTVRSFGFSLLFWFLFILSSKRVNVPNLVAAILRSATPRTFLIFTTFLSTPRIGCFAILTLEQTDLDQALREIATRIASLQELETRMAKEYGTIDSVEVFRETKASVVSEKHAIRLGLEDSIRSTSRSFASNSQSSMSPTYFDGQPEPHPPDFSRSNSNDNDVRNGQRDSMMEKFNKDGRAKMTCNNLVPIPYMTRRDWMHQLGPESPSWSADVSTDRNKRKHSTGYGMPSLMMNAVLLASYHTAQITREYLRKILVQVATERSFLKELEGVGPDDIEYNFADKKNAATLAARAFAESSLRLPVVILWSSSHPQPRTSTVVLAWETSVGRGEEARRGDDTPVGSRGDGRPVKATAGGGARPYNPPTIRHGLGDQRDGGNAPRGRGTYVAVDQVFAAGSNGIKMTKYSWRGAVIVIRNWHDSPFAARRTDRIRGTSCSGDLEHIGEDQYLHGRAIRRNLLSASMLDEVGRNTQNVSLVTGTSLGMPAISGVQIAQTASSKVKWWPSPQLHRIMRDWHALHNKNYSGVTIMMWSPITCIFPQIRKSRPRNHFSFFAAPQPSLAVKRRIVLEEQHQRQRPQWGEYA
ncbi:hypothetical protein ARMGADRAFT_1132832 [Armillaria gallica]|uniref:Uncharacterized protein n=1 Tax=Armillaria gallica TaxID=47427 RepID=A0A2H3D5M3_ARMGA|nr:hypothetical protein ARMGADRAFT_1132832 [Armillaria gallica]